MGHLPLVEVVEPVQFAAPGRRPPSRLGPPRLSGAEWARLHHAVAGHPGGLRLQTGIEAGDEWTLILPAAAPHPAFARWLLGWEDGAITLTDVPSGQTICRSRNIDTIIAAAGL